MTCSLTRGWVCSLLLLLVFASVNILSPAGLVTISYCLRFQIPTTGVPGLRIHSRKEHCGLIILPGTAVPFSSPPTTRRATVEVFDPASIQVEFTFLLAGYSLNLDTSLIEHTAPHCFSSIVAMVIYLFANLLLGNCCHVFAYSTAVA
jgi:hypothetical protein